MQLKLFDDGALSRPAAAALAATAIAAPALAALSDRPSARNIGTRIWYALLRKPVFHPPQAAFPIVWSAIDSALALGAWRLARQPASRQRNRALGLLGANVAMIAGWSKLFFGKRRLGTAAEVADMCVYLLSDESRFVTGAEFVIDGGLTAR